MARGPGADQERPTLRTIAEATGLSLSTVSLALRDGDRLKADTRHRVIEAARRLGYVPDLAGVRLRTGRSNTIGLILDGLDALGIGPRVPRAGASRRATRRLVRR